MKIKIRPQIGQIWAHSWSSRESKRELFIVANLYSGVSLVRLNCGDAWVSPVKVKNTDEITDKEWNFIRSGHVDFTFVANNITCLFEQNISAKDFD